MIYIDFPEQEMIVSYLGGVSMTQLAKLYNVSRYVIADRLDKNNVAQYKHGYFLRICKDINEHYFDVIDTEEKAYFLGLLYADGCNHNLDKKKKISISLQAEDKPILELFSQAILGGMHLNFIKRRAATHQDQYALNIHSSIISNKLAELGCTARKSLTLKFPEWLIDLELQRHFIRGYFDGDGTVGSYKRKDRKDGIDYFAEIVSTLDFCTSISNIINKNAEVNVLLRLSDPKHNSITNKLYIRGNLQIVKFLDWLYRDAKVYLPRKYNKYINLSQGMSITTHIID